MELQAYIQLGFAAGMAIALFGMVRANNKSVMEQNEQMVNRVSLMSDKIATTLENHLSSTARSLALVESNLSRADSRAEQFLPVFLDMRGQLSTIMSALVQSTIVPPGTKVTVEPAPLAATNAELAARDVKDNAS